LDVNGAPRGNEFFIFFEQQSDCPLAELRQTPKIEVS